MTDEKKPHRVVHAHELSGEAHFAWAMVRVERELARGVKSEMYTKFLFIFRKVFNRDYHETPRSFWIRIYGKGLVELVDLGLVEVEKNGEGEYVITAIHEDRYLEGLVDVH